MSGMVVVLVVVLTVAARVVVVVIVVVVLANCLADDNRWLALIFVPTPRNVMVV